MKRKASFKRSHRKAPVEPEPHDESQDASNGEGEGTSAPPLADSEHDEDPSEV